MKITKIKCPSCGYSLDSDKVKKNNIVKCPACGSSFHIEQEKKAPIINININKYEGENPPQNVYKYHKKKRLIGVFLVIPIFVMVVASQYFRS